MEDGMTREEQRIDHIRVEAMAREWCRMMGKDPDGMVRSVVGKAARYLGYMSNMRRLFDAADAVAAVDLERLHRLPGGLLAPAPSPAPAVSFAKQAEAVEREAECRRVSALPGADHWKALSAAAATLRKLAETK